MADPTYHKLGDHTETVQVDYDPDRISYDMLLEIFWQSHRPARRSWSRQYMNAVFFHNEQQRIRAINSKKNLAQRIGKIVKTEVLPLQTFTMAEDYHQKYRLKQHPLKNEMARIYPRHQDFVNSTAVARLNGYVGGYGTPEQLEREIEHLGLSAHGKRVLDAMVRK